MHWLLLLFCLELLTLSNAESSEQPLLTKHAPHRRLTQTEDTVVSVPSEETLQEAFENIRSGQTIRLTAERYNLTDTLFVNVSDVTITSSRQSSVLTCAEGLTALEIRARNTTVSFLEFVGCESAAAVVVEASDDGGSNETSVVFDRVSFRANAFRRRETQNAGLFIRGSGALPQVEVRESTFEENESTQGGAMQCSDCVIRIINSTFRRNVATDSGGAIFVRGPLSSLEILNSSFTENFVSGSGAAKEISQFGGRPLEPFRYFRFSFPTNAGGAIAAQATGNLTIEGSEFQSNRAPAGGALSVVVDVTVLRDPETLLHMTVSDCSFEENQANITGVRNPTDTELELTLGGAVYLVSSSNSLGPWIFQNCNFKRNSARYGGALHLVTVPTQTRLSVDACLFEDNHASQAGGAALIRNADVVWRASTCQGNSARLGGAIMLTNNALFAGTGLVGLPGTGRTGVRNSFLENTAVDGGGLMCVNCADLILTDVNFTGNTAMRSGGALYALDSTMEIRVLQSLFDSNTAAEGGGAAFRAAADVAFAVVEPSVENLFVNNTAVAGAGIFAEGNRQQENRLSLGKCRFERNRAVSVTDPVFPFGAFAQRRVPSASRGRSLLQRSDDADPTISSEYRLTDCGNGGGGGLCLVFDNVPEESLNDIELDGVVFDRNRALVGGGMFVRVSGNRWNAELRNGCASPIPTTDPCRLCRFLNVTMTNNAAEAWGGGLFATEPERILIGCPMNSTSWENLPSVLEDEERLEQRCLVLDGNVLMVFQVTNGETQQDVASIVHSLVVLDPLSPIVNHTGGRLLRASCPSGGDCDNDVENGVKIAVKDVFNQTITGGIPDAELRVILISEDILRQQIYRARNGIVNVDSTEGAGVGTLSTVVFQHERISTLNTTLNFTTRECFPGERESSTECEVCAVDFYSYNATLPCRNCEANAKCAGGPALVPDPGYWHSTPFSPQFHTCIIKEACVYDNRTSDLQNFYRNRSRVADELAALEAYIQRIGTKPRYPDYNQCARGYRGTLCGSCAPGYGYFSGGECVECPGSDSTSRFFVFLTMLWTFFIIGANIVVTLSSTRKQIWIALAETRARSQMSLNGSLSRQVPTSEVQLSQVDNPGSDHPRSVEPRSISSTRMLPVPVNVGRVLKDTDHVIALEKLTETLKITVNYLQVTSVALSINLTWNALIKDLLSVQNLVISVTSGSYYIPLDCVLGENASNSGATPASIKAFWLRVTFPLMFLVVFLGLLHVIHHLRQTMGKKKNNPQRTTNPPGTVSTMTYTIVISLTVLYFSYINLTSEFMRAVNCIEVDEKDSERRHEYDVYAIETGSRVWAEDTSLYCFEGKHTVTGILGSLGLCFSFMVIVLIFVWFPKKRDRLQNPVFIARFGFIYQGYRHEIHTCLWEGVITLRKALIAAAVVFAFPLGPNLQAICALGVLILAIAAHWIVRPFKPYADHPNVPEYSGRSLQMCGLGFLSQSWRSFNDGISLNALEAGSLLMSILVFYSGILFNDDNASEGGKHTMAVFTFTLNVIYIWYILYRFYAGAHVALDMHLTFFSQHIHMRDDDQTFPTGGSLWAFIRKSVSLVRFVWYNRDAVVQATERVHPIQETLPPEEA